MNLVRANGTRRSIVGSVVVAAGLVLALSSQASFADRVQLISLDGKLTLVGEIVDLDSQGYVLSTAFGVYYINSYLVTCEGYDCPETYASVSDLEKEPVEYLEYTSGYSKIAYTSLTD